MATNLRIFILLGVVALLVALNGLEFYVKVLLGGLLVWSDLKKLWDEYQKKAIC